MVRFTILASGSSGNCSYLETEKGRFLIDAGISAKQIELRLEKIGARLDQVNGIFVTHEHDDHVCGLPVLSRKYQIPIYSNRLTADQVRPKMREFAGWHYFETGSTLVVQDLHVETFSVPHDAYDPVGFLFHPNPSLRRMFHGNQSRRPNNRKKRITPNTAHAEGFTEGEVDR